METRCEVGNGKMSTTSRVEIYVTDDDVPTLSFTAPSEEVSEVEDNINSPTSQVEVHETVENARGQAEKIVGKVLNQASEILQSQSPTKGASIPSVLVDVSTEAEVGSTTIDVDIEAETDDSIWDDAKKEFLKNDPEILGIANDFVNDILERAITDAHRRMSKSKVKQQAPKESRENLPLQNEVFETMSAGGSDKRRPWYRRARTSARKIIHRLCVCGRAHR